VPDYISFMDILAAAAVGVLVYNLLSMAVILVQLHGYIARQVSFTFTVKRNVNCIAAAAVIIYVHLFLPLPV
jgi:hypothetical protein